MPTLIDTRNAFRRLREEGGFTEEEADAIVDLFRDADEEVATRTDVERLNERLDVAEAQLEGRIGEVEDRLTQRIELSEERLGQKIQEVRSSVVSAVAAVGAVLAVVIPLVIYFVG